MAASSAICASLSICWRCFSQQTGFLCFLWLSCTFIILTLMWFWLPWHWFQPDSTCMVHTFVFACLAPFSLPVLVTEELTGSRIGLWARPAIDSLLRVWSVLVIIYHFCCYSVYLFPALWLLFAQSSRLFMVPAYSLSLNTGFILHISAFIHWWIFPCVSPVLIIERKYLSDILNCHVFGQNFPARTPYRPMSSLLISFP